MLMLELISRWAPILSKIKNQSHISTLHSRKYHHFFSRKWWLNGLNNSKNEEAEREKKRLNVHG